MACLESLIETRYVSLPILVPSEDIIAEAVASAKALLFQNKTPGTSQKTAHTGSVEAYKQKLAHDGALISENQQAPKDESIRNADIIRP
jgi:hypothetical protein